MTRLRDRLNHGFVVTFRPVGVLDRRIDRPLWLETLAPCNRADGCLLAATGPSSRVSPREQVGDHVI